MMKILKGLTYALVAAGLVFSSSRTADAGTIIKLTLGGVGPDLEYSGGVLSTIDDSTPATTGEQNTAVDFTDFLSGMTDITLPDASYTLNGIAAAGPASVLFGSIVVQPFVGGDFQLYDDSNGLLLDVDLGSTALTGPLGPSATGSVFSVTNGTIVGGSLQPLIIDSSISFSVSMTNINGGAGLSITPLVPPEAGTGTLNAFVADATKVIAGDRIPEPASAALVAFGLLIAPALRRRS